jgi:K+-transporting ATPase ATPase B chain
MVSRSRSLFDRSIIVPAIRESFVKLDPRVQLRNPVMFVVEAGALAAFAFAFRDASIGQAPFDLAISAWLWFTVLFANFAEAMAEGRGKAQADFLRRTKSDTTARRLVDLSTLTQHAVAEERVAAAQLRRGDRVVAEPASRRPSFARPAATAPR